MAAVPRALGELHRSAQGHLQRGDLAAAERDYRHVLKSEPDDFVALHRLGCIAMQSGRDPEALPLFRRAVSLNGNSLAARRNLAAVLLRSGELGEALAAYDDVLRLDPGSADAHTSRAEILLGLQRFDAALAAFDQVLALRPASASLHRARGALLLVLDRPQDALASLERAITLAPGDERTHCDRGAALAALGRHAEALASYDRAIELNPQFAIAHLNRGPVLQSLERPEEALASCDRAIALQPDSALAHLNRAAALRAMRRPAEALASWDRVLELNPDDAQAYLSRGPALQDLQQPEAALASCDRAISLQRDCADAHLNRSGALRDLNRFDEALASLERAIALDPHNPALRAGAGMLHLQMGRFASGWDLYEHRPDARAAAARPEPLWRGDQELRGRTLLLTCEQGLGDTIQFCRYALLALERGAHVVLAAPDRLHRLLRSLSPAIDIIGAKEHPSGFDYHCPLLSLPRAFATTLDTVPVMERYLAAEEERVARWRAQLGSEGFRIGICWQGNPRNQMDIGRSPPLAAFAPLAAVPGVRLISLQKEHGMEQLSAMPAGIEVEQPGDDFDCGPDGFVDAAAVIESLDLVITGDTAIAHLAGALGRPTWVALKFVPEWRWLLDRTDSPWYPRHRLFRQARRGDWEGVFSSMTAALAQRTPVNAARTRPRGRTSSR